MTKRAYGDGSIDQRGENTFRLRYRIGKQRFAITFKGTRAEARAKLRELLKSGDDGTHVEPSKMTVAQWVEHWLSIGAPGKKKKTVGRRSLQRYQEFLRIHIVPHVGDTRLQQLPRDGH
jgi:integrase